MICVGLLHDGLKELAPLRQHLLTLGPGSKLLHGDLKLPAYLPKLLVKPPRPHFAFFSFTQPYVGQTGGKRRATMKKSTSWTLERETRTIKEKD
ncbi:hypothetical protein ACOSP7_016928 [Xanthoceras sorbifolium]